MGTHNGHVLEAARGHGNDKSFPIVKSHEANLYGKVATSYLDRLPFARTSGGLAQLSDAAGKTQSDANFDVLPQPPGVTLAEGLDLARNELVHLLRCSPHERRRLDDGGEV